MIHGHGGNIWAMSRHLNCRPEDILDMSSNVNALGPMKKMMAHVKSALDRVISLPEADAGQTIEKFSAFYSVHPGQVLAGNGTTQLIYSLPLALGFKTALILSPTYSDYKDGCQMHGCRVNHLIADPAKDFSIDLDRLDQQAGGVDGVFICNPNNPTGVLIDPVSLLEIFKRHPETVFVVDESYLPFVVNGEEYSLIRRELPNLVVLNSMSKIFRIPGLRIGFVKSSPPIISRLGKYMTPWSVNIPAHAAVSYLMTHEAETSAFIDETRTFLEAEKKIFMETAGYGSGIKWHPSTASFILGLLPAARTAADICAAFAEKRILIRNCDNFTGLDHRYIRVSLKTAEMNRRFRETLDQVLGNSPVMEPEEGVLEDGVIR